MVSLPPGRAVKEGCMSEAETDRRMAELERLLNDPETRMDAHRVWALLAELSRPAEPARR
jgi:hypothetical protein